MKTIRVSLDDDLLARFDECPDVRQRGRSAVLREAVAAYVNRGGGRKRLSDAEIVQRYREGYGKFPPVEEELSGWEEEEAWPEE